MYKVGFITLGCKVNIYESNALKNELESLGYVVSEADDSCDAYIINTCSVTNQADAKSRKMIRKCQAMNPNAVICVMGCYSQTNDEAKGLEGVDILIGNGNKKSVIKLLEEKLCNKATPKHVDILDILNTHYYEKLDVTTYDHTRAFIKIQDGCENFCTYCIIPYARGPIRSKDADDVISELIGITNKGYTEVVLAGIHTGKYKSGDVNLSGLIKRILNEVPKLERLRLSSIEINEIDDEFIELMKSNKVLADHLHLPLQSGSDLILKKMERKYDTSFFVDRITKIREARPNISITTDVIVGFPYETDEEYQKCKELIKLINFSKLHVFPYSMRRGTKACEMPQVKDSIKKDRALDLIKLSNELEEEYAKKFVGTTSELIVEQRLNEKEMIGHTSNYLSVILPLNCDFIAKNVKIKIERYESGKLYGSII
ncbi:MAG: tRNA (N(6)-L-threonylcarbamoyladenosine(37)-C(2))-methylthiotransferase MtaB [Acholeplasmatales bacterium]|nr:tRNA (N(6)-L-threonylcarbamoyladenosine(37)-C(2))-methylthiotransferase MtaB [Acholeplasmatales bacterium]